MVVVLSMKNVTKLSTVRVVSYAVTLGNYNSGHLVTSLKTAAPYNGSFLIEGQNEGVFFQLT